MKNGRIVSLENKEFKELDELTSSLQLKSQDIISGEVEIPAYRLFELDHIIHEDSLIDYSRSQEFEKWSQDLFEKNHDFIVPDLSDDFKRISG